mgnify:CR=1 FL=1
MKLQLEFVDPDQGGLGFWEGIIFREIKLEKDQEITIKIDFVATEPGLHDLSCIKYTLLKEGNKTPAVITHNMYERIYMEVTP